MQIFRLKTVLVIVSFFSVCLQMFPEDANLYEVTIDTFHNGTIIINGIKRYSSKQLLYLKKGRYSIKFVSDDYIGFRSSVYIDKNQRVRLFLMGRNEALSGYRKSAHYKKQVLDNIKFSFYLIGAIIPVTNLLGTTYIGGFIAEAIFYLPMVFIPLTILNILNFAAGSSLLGTGAYRLWNRQSYGWELLSGSIVCYSITYLLNLALAIANMIRNWESGFLNYLNDMYQTKGKSGMIKFSFDLSLI